MVLDGLGRFGSFWVVLCFSNYVIVFRFSLLSCYFPSTDTKECPQR